jgi:hypothetical protein
MLPVKYCGFFYLHAQPERLGKFLVGSYNGIISNLLFGRRGLRIPETRKGLDFHPDPCVFVVGRAGFEPATNGLKVRCSTS